jgi:DNA polymerase III epsilon subunit-like protein
MLALGAVAFDGDTDQEISRWYATLKQLPGALEDPDTMKWWESQPAAYAEVQANQRDPENAVKDFTRWVEALPGKKIAVAWPATFDFGFVNWYCHRFAGRNPLGFAGLDIRSYVNGLCGHASYYGLPISATRRLTGRIDKTGLRPHVAVDDAVEQGRLLMALRRHALKQQQLIETRILTERAQVRYDAALDHLAEM